jgi:hypothetical protein
MALESWLYNFSGRRWYASQLEREAPYMQGAVCSTDLLKFWTFFKIARELLQEKKNK